MCVVLRSRDDRKTLNDGKKKKRRRRKYRVIFKRTFFVCEKEGEAQEGEREREVASSYRNEN